MPLCYQTGVPHFHSSTTSGAASLMIWRMLLRVSPCIFFFFSSRRRHTRFDCDWSSDVCSSDLFAESARAFAQAELAPHAAHWDRESIFPREAIAKAGELGFCGLYAPENAGGLQLPRLDATMVFEELAAVDPSTTAFITIHNMATWMLGTWATDAVRAEWGEALTSGRKLASYCLTEPGAGSDAGSLKTRAELAGHEYIINGAKRSEERRVG